MFLGLDVGKNNHHALALTADGKRLHVTPPPNTEKRLRVLFGNSPGTAGSWSSSISPPRSARCPSRLPRPPRLPVAYLPSLAMRRIADLHPGSAKTDARDAYVIADAQHAPCRAHPASG